MLSVMPLWGAVHEYLPGVLQVSPEENAGIIRTDDLHPGTLKDCKHYCHIFTAHELQRFLEVNRVTIICLSGIWDNRLTEIQDHPTK